MKQLIYNMEDVTEIEEKELGNRFFLILVNKNPVFHNGVFHELSWSYEGKGKDSAMFTGNRSGNRICFRCDANIWKYDYSL